MLGLIGNLSFLKSQNPLFIRPSYISDFMIWGAETRSIGYELSGVFQPGTLNPAGGVDVSRRSSKSEVGSPKGVAPNRSTYLYLAQQTNSMKKEYIFYLNSVIKFHPVRGIEKPNLGDFLRIWLYYPDAKIAAM